MKLLLVVVLVAVASADFITNGNFASSTTGWTATATNAGTSQVSSQTVQLTATNSGLQTPSTVTQVTNFGLIDLSADKGAIYQKFTWTGGDGTLTYYMFLRSDTAYNPSTNWGRIDITSTDPSTGTWFGDPALAGSKQLFNGIDSAQDPWTAKTVHFFLAAGDYYIRFAAQSSGKMILGFSNIAISTGCGALTTLKVTPIPTSTSVTFTFGNSYFCPTPSELEIWFIAPTTGKVVTIPWTDHNRSVRNLTPNTQYTFKVRIAGVGKVQSPWTTVTVKTKP